MACAHHGGSPPCLGCRWVVAGGAVKSGRATRNRASVHPVQWMLHHQKVQCLAWSLLGWPRKFALKQRLSDVLPTFFRQLISAFAYFRAEQHCKRKCRWEFWGATAEEPQWYIFWWDGKKKEYHLGRKVQYRAELLLGTIQKIKIYSTSPMTVLRHDTFEMTLSSQSRLFTMCKLPLLFSQTHTKRQRHRTHKKRKHAQVKFREEQGYAWFWLLNNTKRAKRRQIPMYPECSRDVTVFPIQLFGKMFPITRVSMVF